MLTSSPLRTIRALLGIALLACALASCRHKPEPPIFQTAGITFIESLPVVHVYGTPAEMGEQQGRLFKPEIQFLLKNYLGPIVKPAGVSVREPLLKSARQMERHMPPEYVEEMRALAAAAEVDYDDVLLANTVFDQKKAIFCSTIVATGNRSADNAPIFGRNLDFPTLGVAYRYTCVVVYHPEKGHAVASVTFPGCIGALSGMNDTGLASAVMEVHRMEVNSEAMPYAILFRKALTASAGTEDLIEQLKANSRSTTNNLMICDAHGNAVCAEIAIDTVAVRQPKDGLLLSTNYFQSEELGQAWPCWRMPIMRALTKGRIVDDALVRKVLSRVSQPILTMQSMIFRPQSRELFVAAGKPPATRYKYIHLKSDILFP